MKSFWSIITGNIPWCVAILIGIGTLTATIKFQGDNIKVNDLADLETHKSIADRTTMSEKDLGKTLVKLDSIQSDLKEIKENIKEIKSIILRPAFGLQNGNEVPDFVSMYAKTFLAEINTNSLLSQYSTDKASIQ